MSEFPEGWDTKTIHKFGVNNNLSATSAPQDIWTVGGEYTWPTEATICYVLSDSGVDQSSATAGGGTSGAHAVVFEGLDANYRMQRETVSLNGTLTAETSLSYLRVFRAYVDNAGDAGTNKGKLSLYQQQAGGDINVAEIASDTGQTLQAIYTVPELSGRDRCVMYGINATHTGGVTRSNVTMQLQTRSQGGAWLTKEEFALGSAIGAYALTYGYPIEISPKTDIRMRTKGGSVSGAAAVGATFDLRYSTEFTN